MKTSDASYEVPSNACRALPEQAEHDLAASSSLVRHQSSGLTLEASPRGGATPTAENHTYDQILEASALIGGSSALSIVIRIARTKALALLLGPAGFGLFGLYGLIASLTQSIAGMGINSSGVRQIAAAVGSGDTGQIAMTIAVLRRTAIVLGAMGAGLLVVFSRQVSSLTFGTGQHAAVVSLLSIAVFFQLVSDGQGALIQGMRRIFDLAKMGVLGALYGTLISIILVYLLREEGVVPSHVGAAGMAIITSWWYSRKIRIQTPSVTVSQVRAEAAALLKLGFAFMASGFLTIGVAYAVRIIVLRKVGLEATGVYQSAWTLGGLYVGFILQAMGADFYPRLTASAEDNTACNRLVNEQARVGLLLAGPGVIATLTFAPVVIALFYSTKFAAAVGVLRWICLGTTLQIITWPMGFIIVAKGKQVVFFGTELAWAIASLVLAGVSVRYFGLNGAGMAFFGSYVCYGILLYPVVHKLSGFRWSPANMRTGLFFLCLIAATFCGFHALPMLWAVGLGALGTLVSGVYSIRILSAFIAWKRITSSLKRLFAPLRQVDSTSK